MKFRLLVMIGLLACFSVKGQDSISCQKIKDAYAEAYLKLDSLVSQNKSRSFKDAVFIVENTYLGASLDYAAYDIKIRQLAFLVREWAKANKIKAYPYDDSTSLMLNQGIFTLMKDSIRLLGHDGSPDLVTIPFIYDFNDFAGEKDRTKMFVTKLLYTYSGNCHNLPYLYKMLADELGATCWLSLAPNHMYIKNRCKKFGWYNTELTNGQFPIDAWITASGYIPVKAIQSGLYMDTLSNQQAIALCMLDLAKGYEFQTHDYEDGFILKCCDRVLDHHPVNGQALLLKAETLKHIYEKQKAAKDRQAGNTYGQMETIYARLFDLGYREMPEKMYMQWLMSINEQKKKYTNKNIKRTLNDK